jgi:hypothetical protein
MPLASLFVIATVRSLTLLTPCPCPTLVLCSFPYYALNLLLLLMLHHVASFFICLCDMYK